MMRILYRGDAAELRLRRGDRFEIRASNRSDAPVLARRDFDGAASLRFAAGSATELELVLGGRGGPAHSPFVQLHVTALRAATRTLERPR